MLNSLLIIEGCANTNADISNKVLYFYAQACVHTISIKGFWKKFYFLLIAHGRLSVVNV